MDNLIPPSHWCEFMDPFKPFNPSQLLHDPPLKILDILPRWRTRAKIPSPPAPPSASSRKSTHPASDEHSPPPSPTEDAAETVAIALAHADALADVQAEEVEEADAGFSIDESYFATGQFQRHGLPRSRSRRIRMPSRIKDSFVYLGSRRSSRGVGTESEKCD